MDGYIVSQMTTEAARERGWQGGVRTVRTTHIAELVRTAQKLVNRVDGARFPAPAPGGEVEGAGNALLCMERAINLLTHAAEELEDERLRLRDGWSP